MPSTARAVTSVYSIVTRHTDRWPPIGAESNGRCPSQLTTSQITLADDRHASVDEGQTDTASALVKTFSYSVRRRLRALASLAS
jgi:hypothetical protein